MNMLPFGISLPFGATWYGVAVAFSVLAALWLLIALRHCQARRVGGPGTKWLMGVVDPYKLAVWCIPAALVGARLLYCLVRFSFFFLEMGPLSVLNTRMGGFLLYGAVLGAMAAAVLLARHEKVSAVYVLDELAAPGMLAILIGRLAECTTTEGVGAWVARISFELVALKNSAVDFAHPLLQGLSGLFGRVELISGNKSFSNSPAAEHGGYFTVSVTSYSVCDGGEGTAAVADDEIILVFFADKTDIGCSCYLKWRHGKAPVVYLLRYIIAVFVRFVKAKAVSCHPFCGQIFSVERASGVIALHIADGAAVSRGVEYGETGVG